MSNHRADRRAVTRSPRVAASRGTHAGRRKTLLRGVPSAPTLVGLGALALAAAGALSTGAPHGPTSQLTAGSVITDAGHASALTGTSDIASGAAMQRRERAVSRDSERQALQDAADAHLQQAAEKQAKERNAALAALAASAQKQAGLIARDAWQLPVTPGTYQLTSRFGECSALWSHCHTGLDFAAPQGTPIHAVANGTISQTAWAGAYGNRTIETLPDGTELWYCHQSAFGVKPGEKVSAGQPIGAVGATGNVTGPHVHLEVRPGAGDPVDPYTALVAHGLKP